MNRMYETASTICETCIVTLTMSGIIIKKDELSITIDSRGNLVRSSPLMGGSNIKFDTCLSPFPRNEVFLHIEEFLDFCNLLCDLLINIPKIFLVTYENGIPTRVRHEHVKIQLGDSDTFIYNYLDCDGIEEFLKENYPSFLIRHLPDLNFVD